MKNLLNIATAEIGVKEISRKAANPRILEYAKETGFSNYTSDQSAWCSLFVNWVSFKSGLKQTKKLTARSWLNVGIPIENSEPGDIVIFWRDSSNSYKGHVGIYLGYSKDKTLGGNQGDMVKESAYSSSQVFGFRRLRPTRKMKFRIGLKFGDTGPEVVELQDALKLIGMEPGTSDGIYGPRTETALKAFQVNHADLPVSGKLDEGSRERLSEQVQCL